MGVLGVFTHQKGKDEKGKSYEERRWYPHLFGKLKGLGVWLQLDQQLYQETLLQLRRQLEAIPTNARLSQKELELAGRSQASDDSGNRRKRIKDQVELLDVFLRPANLQLAIQVVNNQRVRAETVRAVYPLIGSPAAKLLRNKSPTSN